MKRKFLFSILVAIQCVCIAMQISAMEDSSKSGTYASSREHRLSGSLKQMFGVDVKIDGDVLTFTGTLDKVEGAISKFNDFNQLRKDVIPVSTETILTQACINSKFTCWQECLDSLGIQQAGLSNFAIMRDENGCLKIPSDSSFNQQIANMYLEEIKKQSPYFKWMSHCNKQLIQTIDDNLVVNYGLLTEYLCSIEVQPEPTTGNDTDEIFVAELSLQGVLKRLTAAAGSDISLVGTSIPGQYQVRTVMLGEDSQQSGGGSTPTIEIIVDSSSSMGGDKIKSVNEKIPLFLQKLQNTLTGGQSLNVAVYAFSNDIGLYKTYNFTHSGNSEIEWKDIVATGGTDLTKVGDRLKLSSLDERKVVVAFTDGEHTSGSDLKASLSTLSTMQHDGSFAQPYVCRVGLSNKENTPYFSEISKIFDGAFYEHDSVEEFCNKVSLNIPYLLESNIPLILTVDGMDITIRQQDAQPDIHITNQTVSSGDSIMHRGVRSGVVLDEIQRLEAEIARLKLDSERKK